MRIFYASKYAKESMCHTETYIEKLVLYKNMIKRDYNYYLCYWQICINYKKNSITNII